MTKLGTILGIISLGRSFAGTSLYRKFLSGVAVVICMMIVTGMIAGALLLGAFYGVYQGFMYYGMESTPALIATFGLGAMVFAILVMLTLNHLRSLVSIPQMLVRDENPIASRATDMVQAFIDGFRQPAPPVAHPTGSGSAANSNRRRA
jgi:hypothetical protein